MFWLSLACLLISGCSQKNTRGWHRVVPTESEFAAIEQANKEAEEKPILSIRKVKYKNGGSSLIQANLKEMGKYSLDQYRGKIHGLCVDPEGYGYVLLDRHIARKMVKGDNQKIKLISIEPNVFSKIQTVKDKVIAFGKNQALLLSKNQKKFLKFDDFIGDIHYFDNTIIVVMKSGLIKALSYDTLEELWGVSTQVKSDSSISNSVLHGDRIRLINNLGQLVEIDADNGGIVEYKLIKPAKSRLRSITRTQHGFLMNVGHLVRYEPDFGNPVQFIVRDLQGLDSIGDVIFIITQNEVLVSNSECISEGKYSYKLPISSLFGLAAVCNKQVYLINKNKLNIHNMDGDSVESDISGQKLFQYSAKDNTDYKNYLLVVDKNQVLVYNTL